MLGFSNSIGTGFFVSYQKNVYFVTASHVFEDDVLQEDESYALISSTAIKNNKALFSELKPNIILIRNNIFKPYEYDIAIGKLTSLSLFESLGFEVDIIDIDDGHYKIERGEHVAVYGYPSFYEEKCKDHEVNNYVAPYCFRSKVVDEISDELYIIMDNDPSVLNYKGMSGSPVFIGGKLAGIFNAGTHDIDGNVKLLFSRVAFLAHLLTSHYIFLND